MRDNKIMNGNKRTRWQRRPGTTGGKLPWNDWRNASTWRRATQFLLLAINIYIGVTFYYWVRYFETGGTSVYIPRPGGIEGWLPIAGLMNIRYTLETGYLPPIHAASMGGRLYDLVVFLGGLALAALGGLGLWSFLIQQRRNWARGR